MVRLMRKWPQLVIDVAGNDVLSAFAVVCAARARRRATRRTHGKARPARALSDTSLATTEDEELRAQPLSTPWGTVDILTSEPDTVTLDEFHYFFSFTLRVHVRSIGAPGCGVATIDAALADVAAVGRAVAARIDPFWSSRASDGASAMRMTTIQQAIALTADRFPQFREPSL